MTIRGWSFSGPNASTVALPAGTADGDLLVLYIGMYSIQPALPTSGGGAWTSKYTGTGTGTYPDLARLSIKVKTSGDAAVNIGNDIGYVEHSGAVLVALYDVDVADYFTAVGQTAGAASIVAPAGTPAEGGTRLSFVSQMTDAGVLPVFTTPANTSLGATTGSTSGFHRTAGYVDTAPATGGVAVPARTVASDQTGGNVGVTFVVYGGAVPDAVADAGPDQTVNESSVVTLTSAASTDVASRSWSQVSGTAVTLSSSTATSPTFTAPSGAATLVFRVTTLPGGDTDDVTINVAEIPAVAHAGSDQSVDEGVLVTLNSTASTDVTTRLWSQISGPAVALSDAGAVSPTFTAPDVDTSTALVFRVTVTPGGDTDDVTVTVNAVAPPGMPSVTNVKHRSGGLFVARARRIKVGGSFVGLG